MTKRATKKETQLRVAHAAELVADGKSYSSFEEMLWEEDGSWKHSKFNKRAIESLIKIRALKSLNAVGEGKPFSSYRQMLEVVSSGYGDFKKRTKRDPYKGKNIFRESLLEAPEHEEWSKREMIEFEKDLLGSINVEALLDERFMKKYNYLDLMKGKLPEIKGSSEPMYSHYGVLSDLNHRIDLKNMNWKIFENQELVIQKSGFLPKFHRLQWNLRNHKNANVFLELFPAFEKKIFRTFERDREYYLLETLLKIFFDPEEYIKYMDIYKKNKIEENIEEILPIFNVLSEISKDIVNSLDNSLLLTKRYAEMIFHKCRILVYKYRGFE